MSSRQPLPWPLHREWYRPNDGIPVHRLTNPEAMIVVVGIGPRGTQQIVVIVQPVTAPPAPRLAALDLVDAVRAVADDVVAVFEVPELPVDRRHNSKIDRTRLASWAERVLSGKRLTKP